MSTTITMPTAITSALAKACQEAVEQAVAALAVRFEFNAEDAMEHLGDGVVKIQHKRGRAKVEKPVTRRANKSSDKPTRAKTGYLTYADSVRVEARADMETELEEGVKLQPKDVVTEIARRWKGLEEEEREAWKVKAREGLHFM
jgi:hypothetical protein